MSSLYSCWLKTSEGLEEEEDFLLEFLEIFLPGEFFDLVAVPLATVVLVAFLFLEVVVLAVAAECAGFNFLDRFETSATRRGFSNTSSGVLTLPGV